MNPKMKKFLRDLTPPVIWRGARRLLRIGRASPAHYTTAHFHYPLWAVVADRLVRMKAQCVLDIGCGPGRVADLLHDRGIPRYLGVDRDAAQIEQARLACPEYTFMAADALETDLIETYPYDTFLSTEFLEHVEQDVRIVERIRPGARVILSVPSFWSPAHVRWFGSSAEVALRYGPCLQEMGVTELRAGSNGARFFVVEGIR